METKEIAGLINGREYRNEVTQEIEKLARDNGIVIVFAASDDLCEFRGAINDEADAREGTIIHLNSQGLLASECDNEQCPYFKEQQDAAASIKVIWDDHKGWTFETGIPYERFTIVEDGERYGDGIVFRLADVR